MEEFITYTESDLLAPQLVDNAGSKTLVLKKVSSATDVEGMLWQIGKVYTMPDGQQGLKIQRVR